MLKRLWGYLALMGRGDRVRSDLARRLLAHLDRQGSLILDDRALRELGTSRGRLFRVVYDLAMRERIHLRDEADYVIAMSNREFGHFMRRRAEQTRDSEIRRRGYERVEVAHCDEAAADETVTVAVCADAAPVMAVPELSAIVLDAPSIPVIATRESALLFHSPSPAHLEEAWFGMEVAPAISETDGEQDDSKMPDAGKFLPDRKREPWMVFEETGQEND